MEFIQSPKKQLECFKYIILNKEELGFKDVIEPDYDIVIDQMDRTPSMMDRDDAYFENKSRKKSACISEEMEFTLDYGREIVRLFSLICDSQHPVSSFIIEYTSDLVNEENIVLLIDYGKISDDNIYRARKWIYQRM